MGKGMTDEGVTGERKGKEIGEKEKEGETDKRWKGKRQR